MEISDVRVRLVKDVNERLRAVCTVTLDDEFVVRDVKVVEGAHGLFVAMPSRKLSVPCTKCRAQNYLRAKYCNECGGKLPPPRIPSDENGREKVHRDVAHPITTSFRQVLQERVLEAHRDECERAENVGEEVSEYDTLIADLKGSPQRGQPGRSAEASTDRASGQRRRRGRGYDQPDKREHAERRVADEGHRVEETAPVHQPDSLRSDAGEPAGGGSAAEKVAEEVERPPGAPGLGVDSVATGTSEAPYGEDRMSPPATAPAAESEPGPDDQPSASKKEEKPSESDDASDDSAPFGAGIL